MRRRVDHSQQWVEICRPLHIGLSDSSGVVRWGLPNDLLGSTAPVRACGQQTFTQV